MVMVNKLMADTSLKHVVVMNLADLLPFWKRAFGLLADKVPHGKVENAPFISSMSKMIFASNPPAPEPIQMKTISCKSCTTGGTHQHPKGVPMTHGLFLVLCGGAAGGSRSSLS